MRHKRNHLDSSSAIPACSKPRLQRPRARSRAYNARNVYNVKSTNLRKATHAMYAFAPTALGLALYACLAVLFTQAAFPRSRFNRAPFKPRTQVAIIIAVCIATILFCTRPMDLAPKWNGENPEHRNQYELMGAAILHGHPHLDLAVDPNLLALPNPYDPEMRIDSGVEYHWDHALYNGHYYMYFGVVPALLVFAPYQAITGHALTTYHATQLFIGLYIVALFVLTRKIQKRFFPRLPLGTYLLLNVALAVSSSWFATAEPALYCTAISAALAFETWSLNLYASALLKSEIDSMKRYATLSFGALAGALAFGCRPPIALASLVMLIPLALALIREADAQPWDVAKEALCIATPFLLVGLSLMAYNYVRFESFFEFGQTYQLTADDQTNYSLLGNGMGLAEVLSNLAAYYLWPAFTYSGADEPNPFGGMFANYPFMLAGILVLLSKQTRQTLHGALPFVAAGLAAILLISLSDVVYSPWLLERYHLDVYWLMGIVAFTILGAWVSPRIHEPATNVSPCTADASSSINSDPPDSRKTPGSFELSRADRSKLVAVGVLAAYAIAVSIVFFLTPYGSNFTQAYPEQYAAIMHVLTIGIL